MVFADFGSLLERNQLTPADVDLYVFHQASRLTLDSLAQLLRLRKERVFTNLAEVGNTVSASVPIALKDACSAGRIAAGQIVVLCGFGLGLSWASALVRWPGSV
ncbi:MAG: hypothetical protein HUU20_23445 [Pirellulales bacterium]|nr:hypothetical protein [Pirellulales bacterium]